MRGPATEVSSILLLGNYRPTIVLARALGRLGHRIVVGRGGGEGGAEYSRFTCEVWEHPPLAEHGEAFLTALRAFLLERPDVRVVFPVAEEFVHAVSACRDRLPPERTYVLPEAGVVAATLDKVAAYRIAEAAGVPVAPWVVAEPHEDLAPLCARLGYPVVLRPADSTRRFPGLKALIVRESGELARSLPPSPAGLLVQRQVMGRRHNVYFGARAGRIVRIMEAVIDRTDQADGTGLAVAGHTVPIDAALAGYTAALAARLDFDGVGCAQFLVAPDRSGAWFLELNARIGGNHAIAEAAGLELGALAVALAGPAPGDPPVMLGRPGLVYAWTYGDLRGLWAALRRRELSARDALSWAWSIVRTFVAADVHMTWRWDDPLPTLVLYASLAPGLRRLLGPRHRPATASAGRARLDEATS